MLNIFPEGSRSPDGKIHKFEKGMALIVRRARVPVIPAVIVGSFDAWPMHRAMWRMAPIRARFGPPMKLDGLKSDEEIVAAIEGEVRRMFLEEMSSGLRAVEFSGRSNRGRVGSVPAF